MRHYGFDGAAPPLSDEEQEVLQSIDFDLRTVGIRCSGRGNASRLRRAAGLLAPVFGLAGRGRNE